MEVVSRHKPSLYEYTYIFTRGITQEPQHMYCINIRTVHGPCIAGFIYMNRKLWKEFETQTVLSIYI